MKGKQEGLFGQRTISVFGSNAIPQSLGCKAEQFCPTDEREAHQKEAAVCREEREKIDIAKDKNVQSVLFGQRAS